ncbi:hypothetical protein ACFQZX_18570 [Mucilaginibacter litoreus]|uniref:Uncharacterized protein n=1 Tax=Mucilaginibacter litoreus TaxID=1048221 RepID=A0ABW3AX90_9SPHI
MNNSVDIQAIWLSAKTDVLPTSKEMLHLIKRFRNQKLRKKWLIIIASNILSSIIITVLVTTQFKLSITYIGGGLMAIASLLLAATNLKSIGRFYQLDDYNNVDFLAFIEQTRQNQMFYYKKTMLVLVLLWSVGLLLYLYEPTYTHPLWLIIIYATVLVYVSVLWFIVRPRSFKKDTEKLNATRDRLTIILKQLQ